MYYQSQEHTQLSQVRWYDFGDVIIGGVTKAGRTTLGRMARGKVFNGANLNKAKMREKRIIFVRNPSVRAFSCWRDKFSMDFATFEEFVKEIPRFRKDKHCRPQSWFYVPEPTEYYKFEVFEPIVEHFTGLSVGHENFTSLVDEQGKIDMVYSKYPDEVDTINEMYAGDLIQWEKARTRPKL